MPSIDPVATVYVTHVYTRYVTTPVTHIRTYIHTVVVGGAHTLHRPPSPETRRVVGVRVA